jgi:hypothetical protein
MKNINFGLVDVNNVSNQKFVDSKGKESITFLDRSKLNFTYYSVFFSSTLRCSGFYSF